jgi:hypothetical protein
MRRFIKEEALPATAASANFVLFRLYFATTTLLAAATTALLKAPFTVTAKL